MYKFKEEKNQWKLIINCYINTKKYVNVPKCNQDYPGHLY